MSPDTVSKDPAAWSHLLPSPLGSGSIPPGMGTGSAWAQEVREESNC